MNEGRKNFKYRYFYIRFSILRTINTIDCWNNPFHKISSILAGGKFKFARITTAKYNPNDIDEATIIFRDQVLPFARQNNGYKGSLLLEENTKGKSILITLWETDADRVASGPSSKSHQEAIALFASFKQEKPVIENFDVLIQGETKDIGSLVT